MLISALAPLFFAALAAADCNADNCLRALRATQTPGRLEAAQSFCATFTKESVPATAILSYAAKACVSNQVGAPSFRISSACSCIATSTSSATSTATATGAACSVVSSLSAAQVAISPSATPTVPAQLAHDCLNSVPLGKESAIEFVEAIEPYLEFQSDSAYLKNPPADYFYPPLDIFGKLASIKTNLQNDVYPNEYTFQEDLYQVSALAHDGHFVLYPDALTKAFEWGRKLALVSISSDGKALPEIFVYEDVTTSPTTASVVKEINGIDAATYVADFAYTASFNQDADTAYNTMFFSKPFEAVGIGNGYFFINGRVRYIYPGTNTTFAFANGTTIVLDNVAHVKGSFAGVTDGPSFYQQFCTGPHTTNAAAVTAEAPISPPGYPTPVITTNDSVVSGYYLDGAGFDDVAVLSLLAMESESTVEFQSVVQDFIADAKAAGKTKMVIDLSANGGGYILQGYDTFRQFFPQIVQEDYTRFRENEYFLTLAKIFSDAIPADYNPETASNELILDSEIWYNYRHDYNLTEQPFKTFGDKFDPHYFAGDPFTNIVRWNLNDPLTTSNETYGFGTDITGYGSRTNFKQPFAAENIIMLYDGYCASTCTLFSEWMRLQGGVKSIIMGGRPKAGPIQAIGGVKGAQDYAWSSIYADAQFAIPQTTSAEQIAVLSKISELPVNRSSTQSVNLRDNILPGNLNDGLPAHFVVEEADCRLYYTLDMVNDVTALWKGAAAAAFNGAPCVAGAGIKKRDAEVEMAEERGIAPEEAARDHVRRAEMFKRMDAAAAMDAEKFKAKFGKKVIQ